MAAWQGWQQLLTQLGGIPSSTCTEFQECRHAGVESAMLNSCLTVAQNVSNSLLVLPSNLATDCAKIR